jgi:xanthine dehydrogenase accessory factor
MHHVVELLESALAALEKGRAAALCAVVGAAGSTPQVPGALMLVDADGQVAGTVGGGAVEAEVQRRALGLLGKGAARRLTLQLDEDHGWDDAPACGGQLDVAVMPLVPERHAGTLANVAGALRACRQAMLPIRVQTDAGLVEYRLWYEAIPTLLVAGAGHVGQELARQAVRLDFRVRVFDDRPDVLSPERFPEPIERVVGPIAEHLAAEPIDETTYIVIVTRGHRHDEEALHAVIRSPAKYIGMIGSTRKCRVIFEHLTARGVEPGLLERVHAPIGLAIGAVTVPELGISIAGQLVEHRRKGHKKRARAVEGPFAVEAGTADRSG